MITLIKNAKTFIVLHPILYIRSTVEKKICETMFPCVQQNQKKTWLKNLLKNIMMNIYYMRIKDCIEFVFKTRREKNERKTIQFFFLSMLTFFGFCKHFNV